MDADGCRRRDVAPRGPCGVGRLGVRGRVPSAGRLSPVGGALDDRMDAAGSEIVSPIECLVATAIASLVVQGRANARSDHCDRRDRRTPRRNRLPFNQALLPDMVPHEEGWRCVAQGRSWNPGRVIGPSIAAARHRGVGKYQWAFASTRVVHRLHRGHGDRAGAATARWNVAERISGASPMAPRAAEPSRLPRASAFMAMNASWPRRSSR